MIDSEVTIVRLSVSISRRVISGRSQDDAALRAGFEACAA